MNRPYMVTALKALKAFKLDGKYDGMQTFF